MPNSPDRTRAAMAVAEQLLGDLSVETFMKRVFGKVHLHVAGALGDTQPLSVAELDGLLATPGVIEQVDITSLGETGVEAVLRGQADVDRARSQGAGIVVAGIERALERTHPLVELFTAIEVACQMPTRGITAFLSPEGAALPAHNDTYEVVTLQLEGQKRWRLFDLVSPSLSIDQERVASAEPLAEVVLSPGDLLYMPKGQVHQVRPHRQMSFSVAMGYAPPSWMTMIEAALGQLQHDPLFWQSIRVDDTVANFEQRQALLVRAMLGLDGHTFLSDVQVARQLRIESSEDA